MRKTLKFLHTLAAVGYCGAILGFIVLHVSLPDPADLEAFAALRIAMGTLARWVLLPSMALVIVSGLLSMAATPAYQNAVWVWAKLIMGILVFEGTLVYVQGPMERAARDARAALSGEVDVSTLTSTLQPEWGSFWILLSVAVANVLIGVWRPRLAWERRLDVREGPEDRDVGSSAGQVRDQ